MGQKNKQPTIADSVIPSDFEKNDVVENNEILLLDETDNDTIFNRIGFKN